jgi:hypothetical protein
MADFSIAASICTERSFDVMPLPKANPPATIEKYSEYLGNLAASNVTGFEFNLSMTQKYDHRFYKLSQLK